MKELKKYCWLIGLVAIISGCATGPKYSQVRNALPPLNPEQGRIFLYRTAIIGTAVQPEVKLNNEKIGNAVPEGFFYVDRPPGNYQITSSTEVKRTLSLTLDKTQTRFVKLNISLGFFVGHVFPELVEPEIGEKEIQKCHYIENKTSKK